MPARRQPTPVQLDGDGPFVTPEIEAFLTMGIFPPSTLSQLCLILADGRELRLPMRKEVRAEILRKLAAFVPPSDETPES